MARLRVNGLDLYVNRFRTGAGGDRPVVVNVHGLAVVDNAATSFALGFHLARHADVITYDLRGHGRSDRPASGYTVADHAGDLLALIDALGDSEPVHLVAFSYGGAIALVAAMRRPAGIASVSLLDGYVPTDGWQAAAYEQVAPFDSWELAGRAQREAGDVMERVVVDQAIRTFDLSRRRATAVVGRVRRLLATTTLRRDLRREPACTAADFARIDCPVLGIYGEQSDVLWMRNRLGELVPGVELHTIAGADHLGVFRRPDETRPLVSRFIGLSARV